MNRAGLYMLPKIRRRAQKPPLREPISENVGQPIKTETQIEYLYRDHGQVKRQIKPWSKAVTIEAVEEVLEDYLARVEAGYKPEGHTSPPIPFCARVTRAGKVIVEWTDRSEAVRAM